ncbi:hypothetical protein AGMMS49960_03400 [Betaproteobacteria bacterium]|nr:hypothetical protein AGMMS49543_02200 [Betaproteobacteria bacterium]GHT99062.1 hypothetical protein AGMMS49960_03400 [Betaproteobacteria bacterium]GHU22476.1 hypothetical protein AGMMS50243_22140 [Betaproteobacteria bacterium]
MSEQGKVALQMSRIADVFRFAREAGRLEGVVPLDRFGRLRDQLLRVDGAVDYRIGGGVGIDGKARLEIALRGQLVLRCQRCLGEYPWELAVDSVLMPMRVGDALPEDELENDEVDAIEVEAAGELDPLVLIEDEIILALPLVPRHESCSLLREQGGAGRESPFAVLAGLRGRAKEN